MFIRHLPLCLIGHAGSLGEAIIRSEHVGDTQEVLARTGRVDEATDKALPQMHTAAAHGRRRRGCFGQYRYGCGDAAHNGKSE